MEKYTIDLSDYLDRYPQKDSESLEDYQYRIDENLHTDYRFDKNTRDNILNIMFKEKSIRFEK